MRRAISTVAPGGGAYGYGTVFEASPRPSGGWSERILRSFCRDFPHCSDGTLLGVWDTPAVNAAGQLYDTSSAGIFQMTPTVHGWNFEIIYPWPGSSREAGPQNNAPEIDDILLDASGNLYGPFGVGVGYAGAVGKLWRSPGQGWEEKDLFDFCLGKACSDGYLPVYKLAWDTADNLYGVTYYGGTHNLGVAYELQHSADGWRENVIYDFSAYPPGSALVFDGSSNLYGTTYQEGRCDGTVYQLSPQAAGDWKRTILYPFCNPEKYGGAPDAAVVFDPENGLIYGTATAGGDPACLCGVIFSLTPQADGKWKYTVLHKFKGPDGAGPNGLTYDGKGHLFGTTVAGGMYNLGAVFEYTIAPRASETAPVRTGSSQ
ncbi:MAG TPA: choice-of-anchor tandem repeat GloVer-containing protein [Terriglobales bacterium]